VTARGLCLELSQNEDGCVQHDESCVMHMSCPVLPCHHMPPVCVSVDVVSRLDTDSFWSVVLFLAI
jgi:hypothetical protein